MTNRDFLKFTELFDTGCLKGRFGKAFVTYFRCEPIAKRKKIIKEKNRVVAERLAWESVSLCEDDGRLL